MNAKAVLTHLIRAGRDAIHLEQTLCGIGYKETPYFSLHGEIADAIYALLGEDVDEFEDSITYAALHDIYTSDEQCAEQLSPMVQSGLDVPRATMDIICDSARNRNIDVKQFINLILSDWARKEIITRAVLGR